MTAHKPVRTRWVRRNEPKPDPVDVHLEKAKNLPMFGPGIVITVPLHLLPEYLELYSLQPLDRGVPPRPFEPSGILLVRRGTQGGNR